LIRSGEVQYRKIGKLYFISGAEIRRWVERTQGYYQRDGNGNRNGNGQTVPLVERARLV